MNRIINNKINKSSWQDDLVIEIIKYLLHNPEILEEIMDKLSIDKNRLIAKIKNIENN